MERNRVAVRVAELLRRGRHLGEGNGRGLVFIAAGQRIDSRQSRRVVHQIDVDGNGICRLSQCRGFLGVLHIIAEDRKGPIDAHNAVWRCPRQRVAGAEEVARGDAARVVDYQRAGENLRNQEFGRVPGDDAQIRIGQQRGVADRQRNVLVTGQSSDGRQIRRRVPLNCKDFRPAGLIALQGVAGKVFDGSRQNRNRVLARRRERRDGIELGNVRDRVVDERIVDAIRQGLAVLCQHIISGEAGRRVVNADPHIRKLEGKLGQRRGSRQKHETQSRVAIACAIVERLSELHRGPHKVGAFDRSAVDKDVLPQPRRIGNLRVIDPQLAEAVGGRRDDRRGRQADCRQNRAHRRAIGQRVERAVDGLAELGKIEASATLAGIVDRVRIGKERGGGLQQKGVRPQNAVVLISLEDFCTDDGRARSAVDRNPQIRIGDDVVQNCRAGMIADCDSSPCRGRTTENRIIDDAAKGNRRCSLASRVGVAREKNSPLTEVGDNVADDVRTRYPVVAVDGRQIDHRTGVRVVVPRVTGVGARHFNAETRHVRNRIVEDLDMTLIADRHRIAVEIVLCGE